MTAVFLFLFGLKFLYIFFWKVWKKEYSKWSPLNCHNCSYWEMHSGNNVMQNLLQLNFILFSPGAALRVRCRSQNGWKSKDWLSSLSIIARYTEYEERCESSLETWNFSCSLLIWILNHSLEVNFCHENSVNPPTNQAMKLIRLLIKITFLVIFYLWKHNGYFLRTV